ncbi:MAG: NAD(P)/FAD-dependent oxidoreductase [Bacteroidota bacterium]
MYDVAIIGGGLAGLVNSILLRRHGYNVILFEEKKYPFHRVCGEYISNEVIPFLKKHDIFPEDFAPTEITQFHLTSSRGKSLKMKLDLGGFGISRYVFDEWLADKARSEGVEVHEGERVTGVDFEEDQFYLRSKHATYQARVTIGSFGKRTRLDKDLNRNFIRKRSPYIGVKYHIRTEEVPGDAIELHNFNRGYCGVSRINDELYNLCYLSHRDNLRTNGDIPTMEREVVWENPHLKRIMTGSDFVFEKPYVINEVSFEPKEPVFDHVLMSGDSAGMITPLCGNGMAMAIHSAKILSEEVHLFLKGKIHRSQLEARYADKWKKTFAIRHWAGRKIQHLFGSSNSSGLAVGFGNVFPPFARYLMKQTHGSPFS